MTPLTHRSRRGDAYRQDAMKSLASATHPFGCSFYQRQTGRRLVPPHDRYRRRPCLLLLLPSAAGTQGVGHRLVDICAVAGAIDSQDLVLSRKDCVTSKTHSGEGGRRQNRSYGSDILLLFCVESRCLCSFRSTHPCLIPANRLAAAKAPRSPSRTTSADNAPGPPVHDHERASVSRKVRFFQRFGLLWRGSWGHGSEFGPGS